MRQRTVLASRAVLLICLWAGTCVISTSAQQTAEPPLTNASVVKLVRAGFKEKTVIAIIRSRAARFDLSPERLIELKRSGVSERIILAMIGQDDSEFMSDDFGFEDSIGGNSGNTRRSPREEGTGIFGSSGGSRSQSSGRGGDGANEGNTVTTGSATVRILRPPAEEGGMPKLEKTPTLTNESIIQMVEAGFSEGTIIRRIEQSPAEFNLSSTEISELRKRRVSPGVIAAMKVAMSDLPASGSSVPATNPEK
ncbi:MAG: hypothetical protein ABI596_01900 [Pyrinomonadaceae bacterium]